MSQDRGVEPAVDAVLVLSFGGPESPDDVLPFLRNVTRGRNVPEERLVEVAGQYDHFGGVSPINQHGRDLVAALGDELTGHGLDLPVYFGNRNWHPFLTDTVREMVDDGIRRAVVFVTSAFGSYSGCRQYQEDLDRARAEVGPNAPRLDKLRLYYNHPGFLLPLADRVCSTLDADPDATMVFTAHSIPESMAATCSYREQLDEAADIIMSEAGHPDHPHQLVFQSRSGPPSVPWLEPDINDHLRAVAAQAEDGHHVIVLPLGFTSDHMEVLFDLDVEAAATAAELGLRYTRLPTVGLDPAYISMIRQLVVERTDAESGATPVALGASGPWPNHCPPDHCPPSRRSSPNHNS